VHPYLSELMRALWGFGMHLINYEHRITSFWLLGRTSTLHLDAVKILIIYHIQQTWYSSHTARSCHVMCTVTTCTIIHTLVCVV